VNIYKLYQYVKLLNELSSDMIKIIFLLASFHFSLDDGTLDSNVDQLDSSFMYTQFFKEILLDAEYDEQSIKDLVLYWRSCYIGNSSQLKIIDAFEGEYCSNLSICWYTSHWFIYGMLNRALFLKKHLKSDKNFFLKIILILFISSTKLECYITPWENTRKRCRFWKKHFKSSRCLFLRIILICVFVTVTSDWCAAT
jgi:hypothetical protein